MARVCPCNSTQRSGLAVSRRSMSEWIKDVEDLRDMFSYVLLSAPDEFPLEDYLTPGEQMNLERAFEELQAGVARYVAAKAVECCAMLSAALAAYRRGDDVAGARLLQMAEQAAFGCHDTHGSSRGD